MNEQCKVNLQWKGIDACYDFYCPCNPEFPQHKDGIFAQEFTCGVPQDDDELTPEWRAVKFCGRTWHLANRAFARPGKFFRDDGGYGCEDCAEGHR